MRAIISRFLLPLSGREIILRQPTGAEDLLMVEAPAVDTSLAMALARRLARPTDGVRLDWAAECLTDLDTVIVRLRQALVGDRVVADVRCLAESCNQRIDISFSLEAYLRHHAPARRRLRRFRVERSESEPGWYRLTPRDTGSGAPDALMAIRPPTGQDQLMVAGRSDAARVLATLCIRPKGLPRRLRLAAESALEALAPSLADDLQGTCPECGASVQAYFDARQFCLLDLRNRARFVYEELDLLAHRFHWSERDILAIPNVRRSSYAELARRAALS